jgi:pimeloyl-ACP methyl ester carboxylesterase
VKSIGICSNIPGEAIASALLAYNRQGWAAAQADVIGHSMGGLLTRIWTQNRTFYGTFQFYQSRLNYYTGNVHKLITIDSPHLGSFAATAWWAVQTQIALPGKLWDFAIEGAVFDLQPGSIAINAMNSYSPRSNTPASVIAGNDNIVTDCYYSVFGLMSLKGIPLPVPGVPNDVVVAVNSQAPHRPGPRATLSTG